MTKNKYTPNGISIAQIKKYAKKLQKKTELTYQQALKEIVKEKTNYSSWEEMIEYLDSQGGSIAKLKVNFKIRNKYFEKEDKTETIVIYRDKNVIYNNYQVGMGGSFRQQNFIFENGFKNVAVLVHIAQEVVSYEKEFKIKAYKKHSKLFLDSLSKHDALMITDFDSYTDFTYLEKVIEKTKELGIPVFLVSFGTYNRDYKNRQKVTNFLIKHTSLFIGDFSQTPPTNPMKDIAFKESKLGLIDPFISRSEGKSPYKMTEEQKKALIKLTRELEEKSHTVISFDSGLGKTK